MSTSIGPALGDWEVREPSVFQARQPRESPLHLPIQQEGVDEHEHHGRLAQMV